MKIITRLLAIIGLLLFYILGLFLVILIGSDKSFDIYCYLQDKLD